MDRVNRLASLTPKQRALYEKRKRLATKKKQAEEPEIPKRTTPGPWPATVDQTALWFFQKLNPKTSVYNIVRSLRLTGPLQVTVLETAFNEMMRRHEIMRTAFIEIDGQPYQQIEPELAGRADYFDLSGLADSEYHAKNLGSQWFGLPFVMDRAPLFRMALFRLDDDNHVLTTVFHHCVTDWWSSYVFGKELFLIYSAFCKGQPSPLPELPIQFADYSEWREQWAKSPDYQKQLNFWLKRLKGAPTVLELPADRVRPPVQTGQGGRCTFYFTEAATNAIHNLNRDANATSLVSQLALSFVWISRLAGQKDVLMGTPVSAVRGPLTNSLMGYLLNTLVLRADLSRDPTITELITYCKKLMEASYANRDLPFRTLVEALNPERDLSRMPVYQIEFLQIGTTHGITGGLAQHLDHLEVFPFTIDRKQSPVDLQVCFQDQPRNLELVLEYNTDIFDQSTILRMGRLLMTLADGLTRQPHTPISRVPWLTEEERRQMLARVEGPAVVPLSPNLVHDQFFAWTERHPEQAALIYKEEQLTYAQLTDRVERLASGLSAQGIRPEQPVAVCLERSAEAIIALLAVMAAGGVYLPVGPDWPEARTAYVLRDAAVTLVLTQADLKVRLETLTPNLRITSEAELAGEPQPQRPTILPEQAAYLLYTSGSTGKPKGSLNTHANLLAMLAASQHLAAEETGSAGTSLCPFGFDVSLWEIYRMLCHGGTLHLLDRDTIGDPRELVGYLQQHRIASAYLPPALLQPMIEEIEQRGQGLPLKRMMVGVEPLQQHLLERYTRQNPELQITNGYGPTETTVWATFYRFAEAADKARRVPLGGPLAHYRTYLLDEHLEVAPIGVPAELYIAGAGLGRGYLKRPSLSAERFIPNPHATTAGERLYRSGDLAYYNAAGEIVFIGRTDFQVKIRGFRIELEEVRTALASHPRVDQVVVLARPNADGGKSLQASIVTKGEGALTPAELRAHAQKTLPAYMIPTLYQYLPEIPTTANGKVDRKALLASTQENQETRKGDSTAPRTEVERVLCDIWTGLLTREGDKPIGTTDNFFEIGGDSIMAIQVVSRARKAGLIIDPQSMFKHQTIGELASVVETAGDEQLDQGPAEGRVPLTPIQTAFFEQAGPHAHYNQSVMVEVPSDLDAALLDQVLWALISHHDALRLAYHHEDDAWQQTYTPLPDRRPILQEHQLAQLDPEAQLTQMECLGQQLQQSMDLAEAPLLRAALFHLGNQQRDRLLIVIHHLIIDGVSWRLLMEDLREGYEALSAGRPLQLTPKTASFQAWTQHLHHLAGTAEITASLAHWQDTLRPEGLLHLPTQHDRLGTMGETQQISITLDEETTRALLEVAPAAYHGEIDDILLGALTRAMTRWSSNQGDLLVALEGHGRERVGDAPEVSATVGWFTTLYPVRLTAPDEDWANTLKTVKEQLRAIPHKGLSYGLLRYLEPGTAASFEGLAQPHMVFNYLGRIDAGQGAWPLVLDRAANDLADAWPREYALECNGAVVAGRLTMTLSHAPQHLASTAVAQLAQHYETALRAAIDHCLQPEHGGHTPSDFPLAHLDQQRLEELQTAWPDLEDLYPMSPLQQGILYQTTVDQGHAYLVQLSFALEGELQADLMRAAWQSALDRHAALRAVMLPDAEPNALQAIRASVTLPWTYLDWRELEADERQTELTSYLAADRTRGFDHRQAPMLRVGLIRLEERRWHMVFSNHHVLLDGWSTPLLLGEVLATYRALLAGEQPHLPPVRPYRDYIAHLQAHDHQQDRAWWRQYLAGYRETTALPAACHTGKSGEHREHEQTLDAQQHLALTQTARHLHLTPNQVVQAAWALLLARYSGQHDVLFGATVSGRPAELDGVETMVGLFINTLPVRVRIQPNHSAAELLAALGRNGQETQAHQFLPLHELQGLSELGAGTPLFETLMVFENYPVEASLTSNSDLPFTCTEVTASDPTHYPITLGAFIGDTLSIKCSWDPARFEVDSIARLGKHLLRLLEGLCTQPETKALRLAMLDEEEQRQLLHDWNQTEAAVPFTPIQQQFSRMAASQGEAAALLYEEHTLTYAELARRANQLAHTLITRGAGPEIVVGLCHGRTPELLIGLTAILQSGAAYLPLDTGLPADRIHYILEDADCRLVVGGQTHAHLWRSTPAQTILLDGPMPTDQPDIAPNPELQPEHPVYVLYTSGSTGKPKGVTIPHRAVSNKFADVGKTLGAKPGYRHLVTASPNFDPFLEQIFMPLTHGGTSVLVPAPERLDASGFLALLDRYQPDTVDLVPSLMNHYLRGMRAEHIGHRPNHLILGGEALPPSLWRRLRELQLFGNVYNIYGPAEATISATEYHVPPNSDATNLPIGQAMANYRAYVLDVLQQTVPIGAAGELYLAGPGLARGYLNRPALTAQRFLPEPYTTQPGQRMYRTGDVARWNRDGQIEFLGRSDDQVKLRGVRIELDEVRAVLARAPYVDQVEILLVDQQLQACIVPAQTATSPKETRAQLRTLAAREMPEYMVPTTYHLLDQLPVTLNGKLDRPALQRQIEALRSEQTGYSAPRNPREAVLCEIWARLLGRDETDPVGIHDNFYALGGDSIISIQMVSRARKAGLLITPRQIFSHPTVAGLAAQAAASEPTQTDQPLQGPVPLLPIQRWYFEQPGPYHHFNQSLLLRLPANTDHRSLAEALQALIAHHDALRLNFEHIEGHWHQSYSDIAPQPDLLQHHDLTGLTASQRESELERLSGQLQASFQLDEPPLLRAAHIRWDATADRLLLAIHHLVIDGVSWRILLEDLPRAYADIRDGKPASLSPKTASLQNWSNHLTEQARTERMTAQLDHWRQTLEPAGLMPLGEDLPPCTIGACPQLRLQLDQTETRALLQDVPGAYHTEINHVLLCALAAAFGSWSDQPGDLLLTLEGHGREVLDNTSPDLSNTVGWFTSAFPVRLSTANPDWGSGLMTVKEQLRALPDKGMGYGLLRYLNPHTAPQLAPLPQPRVSFNYLGRLDGALAEWPMAAEAHGPTLDLDRQTPHLIDINCSVLEGRLQIDLAHHRDLTAAAMLALAQAYQNALRQLIAHCLTPGNGGHSPSDFPLACLDAERLAALERSWPHLEDIFPTSPLQAGLLFHTRYEHEAANYIAQQVVALEGQLQPQRLRQAWQQVLDRHGALRAAMDLEGTIPLQIITRQVSLPWEELDWTSEPGDLTRFLAQDRARGFDLAVAPLLRITLIHSQISRWLMVLCNHHVLLDGWSIPVLFTEVLANYRALEAGQQAQHPPLRPFREHIAFLQNTDSKAARAYWRSYIAELEQPTPLPLGRPEKAIEQVEQLTLPFSADQHQAMTEFARRHHLTANQICQAAWSLLLARHSGTDDVLFGITVSGRPAQLEGVERMVGLFINTLPVRVRLHDAQTVLDLHRQMKHDGETREAHQYLPLHEIQALRNGGEPLFQTLQVFENYPVDAALAGDHGLPFTITPISARDQTHYPLVFTAEQHEQLTLRLSWDTSQYGRHDITRMGNQLQRLLQGLLQADMPLHHLSLTSTEERRHILDQLSAIREGTPARASVTALFEAQAAAHPQAIALACGGEQWRYETLETEANRLAHWLLRHGAGPEVRVGLSLERTPHLIIALLAILKSGSTVVPLDPRLPAQRRRIIIRDAGCPLLICEPGDTEPIADLTRIQPTQQARAIAEQPTHTPQRLGHPSQAAYVLHTSGSTGQPKGVVITHAALANKITDLIERLAITPPYRHLLSATISFDPFFTQLFTPLLIGGTALLIDTLDSYEPETLRKLITRLKPETVNTVPSMLSHLMEGGAALPPIPRLLLGGERLPAKLWRQLRDAGQQTTVVNLYGPTETTVNAVAFEIPDEYEATEIPIGQPMGHYGAYVLDPRLEPVPEQVPGELFITGGCLARGYLKRPALTATSFIPNPYSDEPGARMYRTGDRVAWNPEGQLLYLGRRDDQVKIRGVRIELNEVRHQLEAMPQVAQSAVLHKKGQLHAFIVPRSKTNTSEEIRDGAAQLLPRAMRPAAYYLLEALPQTASGKLDRAALRAMAKHSSEAGAAQPPTTPSQKLLAQIWADILALDPTQISRDADFFALGGHSLSATRMTALVRRVFGQELPLRQIFATPGLGALAQKLDDSRGGTEPLAPPRARPRSGGPQPLSFAQQRLWFLDRLEGPSPTYNMPSLLRLQGHLSLAALHTAFERLVTRHESLRTHFIAHEGQPAQVIAAPTPVALPVIDMRGLPTDQAKAEANRLTRRAANHTFQLDQQPPWRAVLYRMGRSDHFLQLVQHHIISDGWSVGLLIDELQNHYRAAARGEQQPPEPLPCQYADYAHWQRQHLTGETLQRQLAYWTAQLADAPRALDLPTRAPRPKQQTYAGAMQPLTLDHELTEALNKLARQSHATLFLVLQTAFAELLGRYGHAREVNLGTPVANRRFAELESLLGFFVNTLVLRNRRNPEESVSQRIAHARETALEAYAHQDLPFEKLVEELNPERDPSRSPLFQAMIALQNAPRGALTLPGLTMTPLEVENTVSKFDLTLHLSESEEGLRGGLEYNRDLFEPAMIQTMLEHYQRLLRGMVADPQANMARISIYEPNERAGLLHTWNPTAEPLPATAGIVPLFQAQAARTPKSTAIRYGTETLTYGALAQWANRLSHRMLARGIAPEDRVGLALERTPAMIAAVLATLQIGALYLPLDPNYPAARRAAMIADAAPALILTHDHLQEPIDHPSLSLDTPLDEPATPPALRVDPSQAAYLLYTSGSTGRPKGVLMSHGALANLNQALVQLAPRIGEGLDTLQFATLNFDLSILDIIVALSAGGALVLMDDALQRNSQVLSQHVAEQRVGLLNLPYTALLMLIEAAEARGEGYPELRVVFTSAEQLKVSEAMRAFFARHPQARLINLYGPTETHAATALTLDEPPAQWPDLPSIGNPIANQQAYLLDAQLEPVPPGAVGHLFLAGAGLARGYIGRPAATAQCWIPHPHGTAGERLYVSGDLARRDGQGALHFLGRGDDQVKIRGYRVELDEVRIALEQASGVKRALVLAPGDGTLAACLITSEGTSPAEVEADIATRLPHYMLPTTYLMLAEFPVTANGKVDRTELQRQLRATRGQTIDPHRAPRNLEEDLLSGIWAELLDLPRHRIGTDQSFFQLGGHSLTAARLSAHIHKVFGVAYPLQEIFAEPTITAIAARLGQQRAGQTPPAPRRRRDAASAPLSFAQQRLWFLYNLEGPSPTYNLPSALRLRGPLRVTELQQAIARIVARHESLRTRIVAEDGQPRQLIDEPSGIPLPLVDLSDLPQTQADAAVARLVQTEAATPFLLERGPLLRTQLLRLADEEHVLLLNMHHIIADGWSGGIFVRELQTTYQGEAAPAPLTLQYADYASWQHDWLQGEILAQQVAYWREQLAGAPVSLDLPTRGPRPALQSFAGDQVSFEIDPQLTDALRALAHHTGTTLFLVLETAFAELLGRYAAAREVLLGVPVANRPFAELEPLIGFFVNTLVHRHRRDAGSVSQRLAAARQTALAAFAHGDLPFEKLVEELNPARDTSRHPLFQALIVLQNAPVGAFQLPELEVQALPDETTVAKLDLSLNLSERAGGLAASLVYNRDLFERDQIATMTEHYLRLLQGFAAAPEADPCRLDMFDPAERKQLLENWQVTEPLDRCMHQLIEQRARQAPETNALVSPTQRICYGELVGRANQLARLLLQRGVALGETVAISLDRSPELVISQLAVLKIGATFVPIDPDYPSARQAYMQRDSGARTLLTTAHLIGDTEIANPILIDRLAERLAGQASGPIEGRVDPEGAAYVIYTSGSTGQPKGVLVPHRGVVNTITTLGRVFGAKPGDHTLQLASANFDASIAEIYFTLTAGATLHLAPSAELHPGEPLARLCEARGITHLIISPSALAVMPRESLAGVETLIVAGEACSRELAQRWSVGRTFYNAYGPTEASIGISVSPPIEANLAGNPSMGKALANTRIYLLDQALEPVPSCVTGQLFLAGIGLAHGYLNQPGLTACRFLPDPYGREAGARMYRSGDLARRDEQGEDYFVGRSDFQVKIRGYRVELDEVRRVLEAVPGVARAAVLASDQGQDTGQALLACYVPEQPEPTQTQLLDHLRQHLPGYMVPTALVAVAALPTTPNGKLDREACLRLVGAQPPKPGRAATTELERELVAIWEAVLQTEVHSVEQNFFESGGHSLAAVRIAATCRQRLGQAVPLPTFFQQPTIAAQARYLSGETPTEWTPLVPLRGGKGQYPLYIVHPYFGSATVYRELAQHLDERYPVVGLQARGLVPGQSPHPSIEAMAQAYLEAIRQHQQTGPYLLAGWSLGGLIAFEMARQLHAANERVAQLILLDAVPPDYPYPETPNRSQLLAGLLGIQTAELEQLSPQQQLERAQALARQQGTGEPATEEELDHLLTYLTHSRNLPRNYHPTPYPGSLTFIQAEEQTHPTHPTWHRWAKQVKTHQTPGNHDTLLYPPNTKPLAQTINKAMHLDRAPEHRLTSPNCQEQNPNA